MIETVAMRGQPRDSQFEQAAVRPVLRIIPQNLRPLREVDRRGAALRNVIGLLMRLAAVAPRRRTHSSRREDAPGQDQPLARQRRVNLVAERQVSAKIAGRGILKPLVLIGGSMFLLSRASSVILRSRFIRRVRPGHQPMAFYHVHPWRTRAANKRFAFVELQLTTRRGGGRAAWPRTVPDARDGGSGRRASARPGRFR